MLWWRQGTHAPRLGLRDQLPSNGKQGLPFAASLLKLTTSCISFVNSRFKEYYDLKCVDGINYILTFMEILIVYLSIIQPVKYQTQYQQRTARIALFKSSLHHTQAPQFTN